MRDSRHASRIVGVSSVTMQRLGLAGDRVRASRAKKVRARARVSLGLAGEGIGVPVEKGRVEQIY